MSSAASGAMAVLVADLVLHKELVTKIRHGSNTSISYFITVECAGPSTKSVDLMIDESGVVTLGGPRFGANETIKLDDPTPGVIASQVYQLIDINHSDGYLSTIYDKLARKFDLSAVKKAERGPVTTSYFIVQGVEDSACVVLRNGRSLDVWPSRQDPRSSTPINIPFSNYRWYELLVDNLLELVGSIRPSEI